MKKYLTIKNSNKYYRIIKFEESASDRSIIIRHLWRLHAKSTYHTNYGTMNPPFECHFRGGSGKMIPESVDNRKKFITDYEKPFQVINFMNLPKDRIIQQPDSCDTVLDITNKKFSKYRIKTFSYIRKDLLGGKFDNAVIDLIQLRTHKIVIGCFNE